MPGKWAGKRVKAPHSDAKRRIRTRAGGALPLYYTEFGYQSAGRYRMSEARRRVWALKAMRLVARFRVA